MARIAVYLATAMFTLGISSAAAAADPAPPAPAAVTPASDSDQRMICRRDLETGSLVKIKKTCHTREQWRYIDDVNGRTARDLVEAGTGRPAGN